MPHVDAYHAAYDRDSNSSLKLFRDSIERYHGIRVAKTLEPDAPTRAMLLGIAFDVLVLTPDEFAKNYITVPPDVAARDRRFKENKAIWAEWEAGIGAMDVIDPDDIKLIHDMRDGLMRNATARQILESDGTAQRVCEWGCPDTGLPLKCRFDWLLKNGSQAADLKSTCTDCSPDAVSRACATFGYHRQTALYLSGGFVSGVLNGPMLHIFVSKTPPHETVVYQMDDDSVMLGDHQNRETLLELAACRRNNDWRGRYSRAVQTLRLPKWEFLRG